MILILRVLGRGGCFCPPALQMKSLRLSKGQSCPPRLLNGLISRIQVQVPGTLRFVSFNHHKISPLHVLGLARVMELAVEPVKGQVKLLTCRAGSQGLSSSLLPLGPGWWPTWSGSSWGRTWEPWSGFRNSLRKIRLQLS